MSRLLLPPPPLSLPLSFRSTLPLNRTGLCEYEHPYRFFALQGVNDLLEHGGSKILPTIASLIIPIKNALNHKDPRLICNTLKARRRDRERDSVDRKKEYRDRDYEMY